jgi:hypothetical protein
MASPIAAPTIGPAIPTDPLPEPTEPPPPLPVPAFDSASDIAGVMFERAQAEQVVVSMLDLLGIGLYQSDGSAIRPGSESSDSDYFVFEPEARGLVDLLKAYDDEDRWVAFSDFHAALADLGLQGSAEDLAAAYNDAYSANPDAPVTQFVFGLGGIDVDAPLHPLAPWLLFLDGFVPPDESQATVGSGAAIAASPGAGGGRPGVAYTGVQQLVTVPLEVDPLVIAHLMSVVGSASLTVATTPSRAHEGHGGTGVPVDISATVRAVATSFVSPFSFRPLIPLRPVAGAGLTVNWRPDQAFDRHGSVVVPPNAVTDPVGRSTITFTPRQEAANGEGYLTQEFATVQASVSGEQLVTQLYGLPSLGALVGREISGVGFVEIEWHEPEAMRIHLVNDYDVTLDLILGETHGSGLDSFDGILALQEDGTWRGIVTGTATGSQQSQALGRPCSSSWSATQLVEVVGEEAPDALNGDFYFRFMPVTQPSGSLGSGRCPPTSHAFEGVDYAPYNDYSVSQAAENQGLVIILPQKPGGTRDYPISLPGVVDANWHVDIEFLEPRPAP